MKEEPPELTRSATLLRHSVSVRSITSADLADDAALIRLLEDLDGDRAFRYGPTPADVRHDNNRCAGYGLLSVSMYARATHRRPGQDLRDLLTQLITDLMHLSDCSHDDIEQIIDQARLRYQAERRGDW